jgi:hypothetical protein
LDYKLKFVEVRICFYCTWWILWILVITEF